MKIEVDNLMTVKNYAISHGVTPSYIYKLIREGKMASFVINGVHFIDTSKFSGIPGR